MSSARGSRNHCHRTPCITQKLHSDLTYSVLKTLSEFACAKTCVNALGFSIFVPEIQQSRNVNINKRHVSVRECACYVTKSK